MQIEFRQTVFQAQPLQNVVGVGNTTAYQIVVDRGALIGHLGDVSVPAQAEILNDSEFARNAAQGSNGRRPSWIRRALATLQS